MDFLCDHFVFADGSLIHADIPTISEALKGLYSRKYNKTKTSPLDEKSYRRLDSIYVNLSLVKDIHRDKQRDITYEEVFQMKKYLVVWSSISIAEYN